MSHPRPRARTRPASGLAFVLTVALAAVAVAGAQQSRLAGGAPAEHARAVKRLLIPNAMVIYGNAKPAFGPMDILVENGVIARVAPAGAGAIEADAVIDATGKYVMPGMVNTHMHWHDERGGIRSPSSTNATSTSRRA